MLFDVNRWFLVGSEDLDFGFEHNKAALTFPSASFTQDNRRRSSNSIITLAKLNEVFDASKFNEKTFTLNYFKVPVVIAGLIYMCATIFASATYLAVSQRNLANDYWWSGFNATGGLTYLGNWFNIQLQLRPLNSTFVQLDSSSYADLQVYNGTVSTGVASSTTYADYRQYEDLSDLSKAIAGLRSMDACNVPYLSTQYCFVDFKKRWSLANSDELNGVHSILLEMPLTFLSQFCETWIGIDGQAAGKLNLTMPLALC
ncbi:hypothetical protein THRCLA_22594 [Thraustotheca clavata]|uniref:Uncharacterized protein n=1 Tax=Thraustotheca clavata TaxID=74557 RepID=A0A1V9YW48_9STRA|nr:hypothetical protein THRCLA_22594 [Thraustotheca clavata]